MKTEDKLQFNDINSTENLISFLEDKGRNHTNYHHYTDLDSLIKMIESGYFHLTKGNAISINDQHECTMKGSYETWNRTYIGSFAFGDSENMAMWGLYGLPWEDAVRITIPGKVMRQWIDNTENTYGVSIANNTCIRSQLTNLPKIRLSDIVYIDGKQNSPSSKLFWNDKSMKIKEHQQLTGVDTAPVMTGFIKNNAWKYENEVRINIQFAHEVNCDRIAIKLPEYLINAMTITTGPYFNGDLLQRIEERIPLVIQQQQAQNSGFYHLVQYKTLCSMCEYMSFKRK